MVKNFLKEKIYRRYSISFSKSGDDIQLYKLINKTEPGVYVDIGAWHPVKASNTYFFYFRGWKGICVDPNPDMALLFQKYRNADTFINKAVGYGKDKLYYMLEESSSSMNTFDLDFLKENNLEGTIIETKKLNFISLEKLLDENLKVDERLDFFDIDVEGLDLQVLESNNWGKYRPKIIIVETHISLEKDLDSQIVKFLDSVNYRIIAKSVIAGNLGNLFFIDKNI